VRQSLADKDMNPEAEGVGSHYQATIGEDTAD
jgi:hypothetical protein